MVVAALSESTDTFRTQRESVAFHVGLNVADLDRSVTFYRTLLDMPPIKHFADFAKFEVTEPPLVVALYSNPQEPGGALNHVGLRLPNCAELIEVQRRLEQHGIRTQRQDYVECCYSRQTKFWVTDPDRNLWEIYTWHEDLNHSGFEDAPAQQVEPQAIWEHRLSETIPTPLPFRDDSLDEIRLEGTLNSLISVAEIQRLLNEALRALRPGGRVAVHGLVGDRPFPGTPRLPGMASLVQRIPVETEPAVLLQQAGFVDLFLDKQGDIHCFQVDGVQLRELRISGVKARKSSNANVPVVYKGPFAEVELETGITLVRGKLTMLPIHLAEHLTNGPAAATFVILQTGMSP